MPRVLLFLTLACAGCLADLWSKQAVFAWRGLPDDQPVWWLWPGYVGIQTALNTGAVFGALSGWTVLFATLSVVALSCIVYWVVRGDSTSNLTHVVALACITAGILGNLYDRLGLWAPIDLPNHLPRYAVRDWILLCYGGWTWPNFNLADSFLVCATAVLVWGSWQSPETTSPTTETLD
ncbi:MAG: signal peptidase II [Planctomycetota bacterium]|nr:signal peptidase II [Planctomycetota bacterium]MDA1178277.1 signal peptidase II [Planctomycetota bacterium]